MKRKNSEGVGTDETILREEMPSWNSYAGAFFVGMVFLFFMGIGLIVFLGIYLDRQSKKYTVTNKRVIVRQGIISKHINEVENADIRSLNVRQGIWQRINKFGDVLIGTAGTAGVEIVFKNVHDPVGIKELIRTQRNS